MPSDTSTLARAVRSFDSAQRLAPSRWRFDWLFAAGDTSFAGHFPHHPILPGVFLLEMAQRAAEWALRQSLGATWRISRVQRMRFTAPVQPGDRCALRLDWDAASGTDLPNVQPVVIRVGFSKGDTAVASGELCAVRAGVAA